MQIPSIRRGGDENAGEESDWKWGEGICAVLSFSSHFNTRRSRPHAPHFSAKGEGHLAGLESVEFLCLDLTVEFVPDMLVCFKCRRSQQEKMRMDPVDVEVES